MDLWSSSSDRGAEFSGFFYIFGLMLSQKPFLSLNKRTPRAKNMPLIFYESAADVPLGFLL